MRPRILAAAAAVSVLACGCHHGSTTPGPNDGASLDFTSRATVTIDDAGIRPGSLQEHVGDAVTVTNAGTHDHGLTSDTIDTGTLRPGESTVVYFSAAGRIDAHDRTDPTHTLTIEVTANPSS